MSYRITIQPGDSMTPITYIATGDIEQIMNDIYDKYQVCGLAVILL